MSQEGREDLMSLSLREVLKKFSAGSHKPGSGSAAALLALISAALSRTVIALTPDNSKYSEFKNELAQTTSEIVEIEPVLEKAFLQDSVQFGKVIEARRTRDKSTSHTDWWMKSHTALSQLDVASNIALDIAKASIRLAELSISIFDKGFESARGDSAVAILSLIHISEPTRPY